MKNFDLIIIGGGAAGISTARAPAEKGWQIAMVEQEFMGGTCTNFGCMPTKALLSSAHLLHKIKKASEHGIRISQASGDWSSIKKRKDKLIRKLRSGSEKFPQKYPNITLFRGEASFKSPHQIVVNEETLEADRIVIAAGARSAVPPIPGLDEIDYMTSREALDLESLPEKITILGGGVLAVEFAQIFNRLGTKVSIIEMNDTILANLDPDISKLFSEVLKDEGIEILTNAKVNQVSARHQQILLHLDTSDGERSIQTNSLMIAAGRKPNSDLLNLEAADIAVDKRGFIKVDDAYATSKEGVWAIGDIIGGAMFTHKARHDGLYLAKHLVNKKKISNRHFLVPWAVFTDPEMASVGITEQEADNKEISYEVYSVPFKKIGRAKVTENTEGFIKMIAEKPGKRIIGAHIIGEQAGEIIHEFVYAMDNGGTVADIQDMIHIHPTLSEGIFNTAMLSESDDYE